MMRVRAELERQLCDWAVLELEWSSRGTHVHPGQPSLQPSVRRWRPLGDMLWTLECCPRRRSLWLFSKVSQTSAS